MAFLPWWLGALALGGIAVGFFFFTRRTMGVSGSFARVLEWRVTRARDREQRFLDEHRAELAAALREATSAEFGESEKIDSKPIQNESISKSAAPLTWSAHATFLTAIVAGALAAAWWRGGLALHRDLGADFGRLVASGWRAWVVLGFGGLLVGFGTRLAGGCTSGHGLSGCGRLQPGSLVATAVFFGCAAALSLALGAVH